jgi:predicted enzyme related to lactoylglutathione lyase
MSERNNTINYIELPLADAAATKAFYGGVFGWEFTNYGPNYIAFAGAGIDGGFNGVDDVKPATPGVLVVLYADNLENAVTAVETAGGTILKPIYSFPGGQRFHFRDPNGNELAVWSE